jgi:hypothetical protein
MTPQEVADLLAGDGFSGSDILPHGSGIDCKWHVEVSPSGNVVCSNSFHLMDENGMYDGWQDFTVTLFRHKRDRLHPLTGPCEGQVQVIARKGDWDFRLTFQKPVSRRPGAYGLRDYLEETIHHALSEAGILASHTEVIPAPEK